MLKIGVFDDDETYLEYLYNQIIEKLNQRNIYYDIDKNTNLLYFESLLKNKEFHYDILFWDIHTKEGTSLQLAKDIYQQSPHTQMIYVTSHNHYLKDIFDSNVLYYLEKQDIPYKMDKVIDKMMSFFSNQKLVIKNKNSIQMIDLKKIMYIERKLRITYIITMDNVFISGDKLNDIMNNLNSLFVRTHNSFIVNKNYVEKITRTSVLLSNNMLIPISRKYNKLVKEKIIGKSK